MAEISKKLHYRKGGVTTDIRLYSATADVGSNYLSLRVDGATVYARLGGVSEHEASDMRVQKGGVTYTVQKSNLADLPSGFIAMFEGSCPTGWTRETEFDGKFPKGAASYGATGGADTHTHNFVIPSQYCSTVSGTTQIAITGTYELPPLSHKHYFPGSWTYASDSVSSLPPYVGVVFCRKV